MTDPLHRALADRYRIVRELGAGGMATVYLAHDLKHDRDVAVKVLKPEIGAAVGAERFLLEIKTTANLRHPHIVPLYDSGEVTLTREEADDGPTQLLYYVMPVVEGESLRQRLDREKMLSIDDALRITREVADAVGYAHARGIIHRDIKPENIMIEGGHAVVADFGIARAMRIAGRQRITQTGMSVGTPVYMSPEQAAGDAEVDARSDQYSLACVCYEMLAGQPPFIGPSAMAITRQHMIVDAPSIANLRAGVPPAVVSALQRALAKAPADRFDTINHFGTATESTAAAERPSGPSRPAFGRRNLALGGGITALAVLFVVLGIALWKRNPQVTGPVASAASVAVLPFTDLSADHANAFLGDGVAETLIDALANVPGLMVTARSSAFAFRDSSGDLPRVGRHLHVANVLEGSVQRAGQRLRITASLIRTSDGFQLWSRKFDRSTADIFAVQDEVARAVVAALQLTLAASSDSGRTAASTRNPAAYEAYMLGRYHWNRRTTDGMIQATAAFKKALALDSSYALAWAGLADTYVLSIPEEYNVPGINPDSILTLGEQAARHAIAIAPGLGEAQSSLGEILDYRNNKHDAASAAFKRGIALAPSYPTGHQWYAYHLWAENRWDDAIREMEAAHHLDPQSHVITLSLAVLYDGADRFTDATPLYAQGLAQSPEAWYAWAGLVGHELATGHLEPALAALRKELVGFGVDSALVTRVERGLRAPATRPAALHELVRVDHVPEAIAFARWLDGDEAAINVLERIPAGMKVQSLNTYVYLGPKLRNLPRVQALGPRLGWWPNAAGASTP